VKAVCGESCKHGLMGAEFPQGGLATLHFEPEGQLLASLSQDEFYVWDIQTAKPIESINGTLIFCYQTAEGVFVSLQGFFYQ